MLTAGHVAATANDCMKGGSPARISSVAGQASALAASEVPGSMILLGVRGCSHRRGPRATPCCMTFHAGRAISDCALLTPYGLSS